MSGFGNYDSWKLATPPEYELDEDRCCEDAPHCDCEARAKEDAADDDGEPRAKP